METTTTLTTEGVTTNGVLKTELQEAESPAKSPEPLIDFTQGWNAPKALRIPSIDGKDLYLTLHNTNRKTAFDLYGKDGRINPRRFSNSMDYSLDQIKLREVYEGVYRRANFSFSFNGRQYCDRVINVTFKYSCDEFNRFPVPRYDPNDKLDSLVRYVRFGVDSRDVETTDRVLIRDGELIAIDLGLSVDEPISPELLAPYFTYEDGRYRKIKSPKHIASPSVIRRWLYQNGFWCGETHYIRWKRSAGSSRRGKVLFIDEALYSRMHRWEMCGLDVRENDSVDLAALESYISLPLSSIVGTIKIDPRNILVIDDYDSQFDDSVVSVEEDSDRRYVAKERTCTISNCIWDGQGLIDISIMGKYASKGMILLRNLFFKCCCFNTNLQQWFRDNGITEVSQLKGKTLATRIEDIKFVTTPSSIKYVKFGTVDDWLSHCGSTFGVVKYDKPTHFFDGRLVQTHYQLLNTLQMSREEVGEFLKPTFDYIDAIKRDPAVLRYHIKYPVEQLDSPTPVLTKNDVIYKMLGITDRFSQTKLYADFRVDLVKAFVKSLRYGHVLVEGNYSTLFGNPVEMLNAVIGKFDGRSTIMQRHIRTTRFPYGERLLGSRSPHISMNSVWVTTNQEVPEIDRYFNLTNEIVCINSIGENVLNQLSGSDFDSDSILLTDNKILVNAALRNDGNFRTAISNVSSSKRKRTYNNQDKADLDIKTSNNMIGDLINVSQELNTLIWDKMSKGATLDDINSIYLDVCILNIASEIEIDKAKKEFNVDSAKELGRIREKYRVKDDDGRIIKPNFFGAKDRSKGYYDPKKNNYKRHNTTMDYLQEAVCKYRAKRSTSVTIKFSELINTEGYMPTYATLPQINTVVTMMRTYLSNLRGIYSSDGYGDNERQKAYFQLREEMIDYIGSLKMTRNTMIYLLRYIDNPNYSDIARVMFEIFFSYPNESFYSVLDMTKEPVPMLERSDEGEVDLYGIKFTKIYHDSSKSKEE